MQKISTCLWFDTQAEDAANFYTSIFPNSKIGKIAKYGKEGFEIHGKKEGTVMTVEFFLGDQKYLGLNGGPIFKFSEAISLVVNCESQKEVDHYWNNLSEGGDPNSQQCGWLKDKFGLSWQIIPTALPKLLSQPDPKKADRVMKAMLQMKKINIEELEKASGNN